MRSIMMVGIGSAPGSLSRYGIVLMGKIFQWQLPGIPTFIANIIGCFLFGILITLALKENIIIEEIKLFLSVGFCGGLTTFSTFTAENFTYLNQKSNIIFALYTAASLFFSLVAPWRGSICIKN
ncbi:MAG TPA: CrcB family protein [Saprospiraceae bacterium]|nr:CrcB family protein [Saprospiraceae bacterium]